MDAPRAPGKMFLLAVGYLEGSKGTMEAEMMWSFLKGPAMGGACVSLRSGLLGRQHWAGSLGACAE